MKITFNITVFFFICLALLSCEKYADDYKSFLNDEEMVYPGVARNVGYQAGDFRTKLYWNPSPDPTITKYVIKWNNGSDSLTVNTPTTNPAEQVTAIVTGLEEYVYSFVINSYDAAGNKSIPIEINNVRVYGDAYKSSLFNRTYNLANPYVVNNDRSVKLNFNAADTMNIATTISYTNTLGQAAEVDLLPGNTSITLPDYKFDTAVKYRSSYIPEAGSIDTFYVTEEVTFPEIIAYFECDKSLFREHRLPLDIDVYQFETGVFKLWDGSVGPQGYPNIFHTIDGGGVHLPHVITFDMGKTYTNLAQIEETGRDCCNNPTKFEVWGIDDITNAATTLRADNPGWKDEAIAKGWKLLKEVVRTDNGNSAYKVALNDNPPPVRYIRIRIVSTSNGSSASNMSEITFWNRE